MKRSTLLVLVGAGLALIVSTSVLAAGRSNVRGAPEPGTSQLAAALQSTEALQASPAAGAAIAGNARDGAACSSKDECKSNVCEGGSCCTDYGASCDSSSHCCGHQSC